LTIALSVLTAVLQTLWNKTGNDAYLRLTKFFGKLFLINFAMGVVTGIVQEFQFGMNWSEYSRFVGDIFGAPLALEALIAFFLESTFLGLWIFGWDRLSKGVHLVTIWLASIGTVISSIFIIAANAWMQNPVGATYNNGRAELTDFGAVLTNPVFLWQWPHTITASFVTAGAFMAAVAAYGLIKTKAKGGPSADLVAYRKGVKLGAWVLIVAGVFTVLTGDPLGKTMVQTQPSKMAAAEAQTTTSDNAPFALVDFNGEAEGGRIELFPGFLNWLYGTDEVQGIENLRDQYATDGYLLNDGTQLPLQAEFADALKEVTDNNGDEIDPIPNVMITFWSFRLMIGIGCLAILGGVLLLVLTRGDRVPKPNKLITAGLIALPILPLVANSFGWIFTEMGRQPWIVNGVLPTLQGLSPSVGVGSVWFSLIVFTLLYGALAVIEVRLMLKYIRIGLPDVTPVTTQDEDAPLSFAY
jgi:cytochrome d ubiquinol oxidase subunit I